MERSEAGRRLAYQRPSGRLGARIDRYPSKKRLGESCSFEKTANVSEWPRVATRTRARFRCPVCPAHRPQGPRAARLCPHCPPRYYCRTNSPARPTRPDPLRRAVERVRARCAWLRPGNFQAWVANLGNLLRDAIGLPSLGPRWMLRPRASSDVLCATSSILPNPFFVMSLTRRACG